MIREVNNCLNCEICRRPFGCPNRHSTEYICDDCSDDVDTLYEDEDGIQRCLSCVLKLYKIID